LKVLPVLVESKKHAVLKPRYFGLRQKNFTQIIIQLSPTYKIEL